MARPRLTDRGRAADAARRGGPDGPGTPDAVRAPPPDPRRPIRSAADGRRVAPSRRPRGGPSPRRSSRSRHETMSLVIDGGGPKGDVLGVAELAGVMGGKRTSDLIPLCHPLALTDLVVAVTPDRAARRAAHPRRGRDDRADRGRDGGPHGRVGRGAHRLRHGQGRRARRRDPGRSASCRKTGGKSGEWHRTGARSGPAAARSGAAARPGDRAAGRIGRRRGPRLSADEAEPRERADRVRRTAFVLTASDRSAAGSATTRQATRVAARLAASASSVDRARRAPTTSRRSRRALRDGAAAPSPGRHDRRDRPDAARRDARRRRSRSSTTRSPGSPRRCGPRAGASRRWRR